MQKHSLFKKYFAIFSLSSILSILVLGIILLVFASQYFQNENYAQLGRNANQAAAVTAANYVNNNRQAIDRPVVTVAYSVLANSAGAEIFFTDVDGRVLLSTGDQAHSYQDAVIPGDVVDQALVSRLEMTTTLSGLFPEAYYVVGVPVQVDSTKTIGVVFVAASAISLRTFLREMTKMFVVSAAVVLFVSTASLYIVTMRLVRPLKDMLFATQSFTKGDFTKRVPVGGYDEIGQLAMAFNNMASTLAITEQTRRSFIANVSHELKTPMTTIGGFVDGILDGTVPPEKQEQYLRVVSNEVKRLSRLVRSMLDTARIEAGEMAINPVSFDISEIIRQTVFTFEHAIEEKKLEIIGLDVYQVMVKADVDLMHQVMYNLVENAVKFVNENGTISFGYRNDGVNTMVSIRNSGEGLERSEIPKLFERFYKSDKSRSLNKNGTGLGLHIVKSIVNYHKGEIVVRSVEGEYAEFEISLPNPPKKEHAADRQNRTV